MTGAVCKYCRHFRPGLTCRAFPGGIPGGIIGRDRFEDSEKARHVVPVDGDGGFRFWADDDVKDSLLAALKLPRKAPHSRQAENVTLAAEQAERG